jgi:hypothetical protein
MKECWIYEQDKRPSFDDVIDKLILNLEKLNFDENNSIIQNNNLKNDSLEISRTNENIELSDF